MSEPPEDPLAGLFGDLNGSPEERAKAARIHYEALLADFRQIVTTHVEGFVNAGMSREEALGLGGQLHAYLLSLTNR